MAKVERCFADTNIFLRYLTNDIPSQADAVERLLKRAAAGKLVLVTSVLVMAEIVWTMESYYALRRPQIQSHMMAILNTGGIEVENRNLILQALAWYGESNVDFIDAYNAAWLQAQDLKCAYTFDQKHFSRFEGIQVRVPE